MAGINSTITTVQTLGTARIVEFESRAKKHIVAALLIENKQINDIIKLIKKRNGYYQILFVAKPVTNPDKDIIYASHIRLRDNRNHLSYKNMQLGILTIKDAQLEAGVPDNTKFTQISASDPLCVWNLIKPGQVIRCTFNIHAGRTFYQHVQ